MRDTYMHQWRTREPELVKRTRISFSSSSVSYKNPQLKTPTASD
jgi:hypothetical protein